MLLFLLAFAGCGGELDTDDAAPSAVFAGRLMPDDDENSTITARAVNAASAWLRIGEFDRAIRVLDRLGATSGSEVTPHNNLAVAYLARFEEHRQASDLLAAMEHANRAAHLSPNSPEALYNRALVLSRIPLPRTARRAWREYFQSESTGIWAVRGTSIETRLVHETEPEHRFEKIVDVLLSAELTRVSGPLAEALARYPLQIRKTVEREGLLAWADSVVEGRHYRAERQFEIATAVAHGLAERRGDRLLLEALESILAETAKGEVEQVGIASAHRAYALGMLAYEERRPEEAIRLLENAKVGFEQAGSPFALLADLHLGVLVYLADLEEGSERFESLAALVADSDYLSLAADLEWMRGLVQVGRGKVGLALAHYQASLDLHQRASGLAGSGAVEQLLAEALEDRGEVSEAWQHRIRALNALPYLEGPRRRHATLNESAIALVRRGRTGLADLFLEEVLDNARAWGKPEFVAEGLRLQSRLLVQRENFPEALVVANQARETLENLEPSPQLARLEASLWLTRGMALAPLNAAEAISELDRAWQAQRSRGFLSDRLAFLLARARASRVLGKLGPAEEALLDAVEEFERLRRETPAGLARGEVFQWAQQVFDELLDLRLARNASAVETWEVAEWAKGRVLLDRWLEVPMASTPLADSLEEIASELPSDSLLVAYHVLRDRVVAWRVHRGGVEQLDIAAPTGELLELTEGLLSALAGAVPGGENATALQSKRIALYRELVEPLALPEEASRLIVVPDRFLAQVPFAILAEADSKEPLIARVAVALAPSALLATLTRRRAAGIGAHTPELLVVSDPELSASDAARFPPLAGARAEADEISTLYEEATLLTGAEATVSALFDRAAAHSLLHYAGHAAAELGLQHAGLLLAGENNKGGRLTLQDLFQRDPLGLELVVLAACESAALVGPEREGLFGLAAGFVGAGVPAVLAARSEIDDRETRRLMIGFHKHYLQHRDAASALRLAWLDIRVEDAGWQELRQLAAFVVLGG